jgi:hypothetical protein
VLVVHITNRSFRLQPVLASAARQLHLEATVRTGGRDGRSGVTSTWVAMARDPAALAGLRSRPGWQGLGPSGVRWTDDYSSVLPVLRLRGSH